MTARRRFAFLVCSVVGIAVSGATPGAAPVVFAQEQELAIVGGTVVDGTGAPARPDTTILVRGERIARIGPSSEVKPSPGARVVQARGKFVIPGLVDAHCHYRDYYAELLVTHGITSIVDWGGSPMDWTFAQKNGVQRGVLYGPRVYTSGEVIPDRIEPEQARKVVRDLKTRGVDKIDVGFGIRKDTLLAVIDEAKKNGLPVSGYPIYTRAAIEAGITAIKHTYTVGSANTTDSEKFAQLLKQLDVPDDDRDARLYLLGDDHAALAKLMVEKKVAWVPTLLKDFKVVHDRRDEYEIENYRLLANPQLQYLPVSNLVLQLSNDFPTGIADVASGRVGTVDRTGEDWKRYRAGYKNLQSLIRQIVNGGGHVLAGTAPHSFVLPGLSLHQELQLFIDAGLTPMQALQSASLWVAEYVNAQKDIGSLQEGKLADLVILTKDPLENVRNLRAIEAVYQGGRQLPTGYHWSYVNPVPRTGRGAPGEGAAAPQLDTLAPSSVAEGAGDSTIVVKGKSFVPTSVVFFERLPLETTYVSPTELKAVLPARFARTAGTYFVRVRSPRPGGGDSATVPLTVQFR